MSIRTALTIAGLIGALSAGVAIGAAHGSTDTGPAPSAAVAPVQEQDDAPAQYLGENDPIVPLVCGVNLDCSTVDQMHAAQAKPVKAKKPTSSRTVKSSRSSNGASSATVTTKSPAGSSTVTKSRTAKGVTTTSRSATTKK